ncbi:MAG TPA: response regulator transcription factor [Acidimicrobiales bacterium]|nr:response regulator transcription factor [Acidimicrobiales bacterium]
MSTVQTSGLDKAENGLVLIVEDHRMLAEGLRATLKRAGIENRVVYPSKRDDVLQAQRKYEPRVILLDLDLGLRDGGGASLVRLLVDTGATVILITGSRDRYELGRCLEAGAQGVIDKALSLDQLIDTVRYALRGEPLPGRAERDALIAEVRQKELHDLRRMQRFLQLSPREAQVLQALADGRSVEDLVAENFVSVTTVRSQVRAILQKLGVHSQLAAVAAARQSGWLEARSRMG